MKTMKHTCHKLVPLVMMASLSATIAQSDFSGIYIGSFTGGKFTVALTGGGRALGAATTAEEWGDVLNPAKSTINEDGDLKGATPNGASINATVSGKNVTGTIKEGGKTVRFTGKRTFN